MIKKLQKKFIFLATITISVVITGVFFIVYNVSLSQVNSAMDLLVDNIPAKTSTVSSQNGKPISDLHDKENTDSEYEKDDYYGILSDETEYSMRYFIVYTDLNKNTKRFYLDMIAEVDENLAQNYTEEVLSGDVARDWIDDYRYKIIKSSKGYVVIFADGSMMQGIFSIVIVSTAISLMVSELIIIALLIFFSKRIVYPIAESFERQKMFITNANHELKTPLSLMLANVDIVEKEMGKNEWFDDIRSGGQRMNSLINNLVTLSRMDEDVLPVSKEPFNLSDVVIDTLSEFRARIKVSGLKIVTEIQSDVMYNGNELMIRQLVSLLLDNALKYCDSDGTIKISLSGKRKVKLFVENTFENVESVEVDRLFERFYRYDNARTYSGSFGIGLSIAKTITEKHNSVISAYKKGGNIIGFKVVLK